MHAAPSPPGPVPSRPAASPSSKSANGDGNHRIFEGHLPSLFSFSYVQHVVMLKDSWTNLKDSDQKNLERHLQGKPRLCNTEAELNALTVELSTDAPHPLGPNGPNGFMMSLLPNLEPTFVPLKRVPNNPLCVYLVAVGDGFQVLFSSVDAKDKLGKGGTTLAVTFDGGNVTLSHMGAPRDRREGWYARAAAGAGLSLGLELLRDPPRLRVRHWGGLEGPKPMEVDLKWLGGKADELQYFALVVTGPKCVNFYAVHTQKRPAPDPELRKSEFGGGIFQAVTKGVKNFFGIGGSDQKTEKAGPSAPSTKTPEPKPQQEPSAPAKGGPSGAKDAAAPGPPDPREACRYGLDCYRKTEEHFEQFAHPKDHPKYKPPPKSLDAKGGGASQPKDADPREACRYGMDCYRKTEDHFEQFAHPKDHPKYKPPPRAA